jgi:hypothetical protein
LASNVDIANAALIKLGEKTILSLTDDNKPARTLNAMFVRIRQSELRAHNWSFSIKRAQLAAQATTPLDYAYAYRPPADNLKLVQVGDFYPEADLSDYVASDGAGYAYENGLILTDLSAPLKLRYIADIDDPTLFDANFVEAFACKLAMEAAEPLSASTAKRQLAFDEYKYAVATALRSNAIEKPPVKQADDTWVLSRL